MGQTLASTSSAWKMNLGKPDAAENDQNGATPTMKDDWPNVACACRGCDNAIAWSVSLGRDHFGICVVRRHVGPSGGGAERFKLSGGGMVLAGSRRLQEVGLPVVATLQCANRWPNNLVGVGQICAGFEGGEKKTAAMATAVVPSLFTRDNRCLLAVLMLP
jgi:hypothetical protein